MKLPRTREVLVLLTVSLIVAAGIILYVGDGNGESTTLPKESTPPHKSKELISKRNEDRRDLRTQGRNNTAPVDDFESKAMRSRKAQMAKEPDAFFDPDRTEPKYLAKIRHHQNISAFLNSSRVDDPNSRRILSLLLEFGYGIDEWSEVTSLLGGFHIFVDAARGGSPSTESSESEHDNELKYAQDEKLPDLYTGLKELGITDRELIHELVAIEFPIVPNEDVIGIEPTILGDRLYADNDWMNEEFQAR